MTSKFLISEGTSDYIEKLLQGFNPSEILYAKPKQKKRKAMIAEKSEN